MNHPGTLFSPFRSSLPNPAIRVKIRDLSQTSQSHRTGRGPRSPLTAHVTPAEPALSLGPETQHTRAYDAWSVSCPINCCGCVALRFRLYFATLADFSARAVYHVVGTVHRGIGNGEWIV